MREAFLVRRERGDCQSDRSQIGGGGRGLLPSDDPNLLVALLNPDEAHLTKVGETLKKGERGIVKVIPRHESPAEGLPGSRHSA